MNKLQLIAILEKECLTEDEYFTAIENENVINVSFNGLSGNGHTSGMNWYTITLSNNEEYEVYL